MKIACKLIYIKYEIKNAQSYDRPTVKKKGVEIKFDIYILFCTSS